MQQYLAATKIIDWQQPKIQELATQLAQGKDSKEEIAKTCFEWVRDNIKHSSDYQMNPVTCSASEVLKYRTGYCFAKSHLLAALFRASGIPAGFCYQRLSVFDDGVPYSLHGFNAVYLPQYGWYRLDARGNKLGVDAQFMPPQEKLAYGINFPEEVDCKKVFAEPLDLVITALQKHDNWNSLLKELPDVEKSFFNC
ncbi:Transglutaminase-like enzyme, predicted cysteine protease [Hyella patelloides LEGE 07179]|uniref:Transglutaminase-like enzyme, predicted cysteine protease n=1 Tax=Hyella patelloides LEGE 07179 TaxID=945734 RepID=A0A563VRC0_9CYAN|nr:transglutaminase family protein [Hyella patelloides]VEP13930.1 Transglutaminase-like enzyme, predicted cysteine protease [Hyella patelloides LEGE 07179]